ncbi:MAG TPA: 3-deoxy-7-phosphoheptulonate synthase [Polyangiaceae bacterium]|nr:3-deoxy-7-phosphoheptulonate synthase [Polyangiaceae bacterium]
MSFYQTDDLRIEKIRPLIPPAILIEELPLDEDSSRVVAESRLAVRDIMDGRDDRMLVVVGPCSIHDVGAALEYGKKLAVEAERLKDALLIVMRVYFEKPRTTVGWKGLINDPDLDGSFAINKGLRLARGLLLDLLRAGVPCGTEFLDTITPQFIADLVTWGAIGARTTESQVHRELASGLSMPVGFKNGTDGNVQIAVDAIRAASHPHHFLSVTKQGIHAIVATRGNDRCHVILRGGNGGPNYDAEHVARYARVLESQNQPPRMMIDASHGTSSKDHRNQPKVAHAVADYVRAGETRVFGIMIESHLVEGRQDYKPGQPATYGQSITDACLAWEETVPVLEDLADAVRTRRARTRGPAR